MGFCIFLYFSYFFKLFLNEKFQDPKALQVDTNFSFSKLVFHWDFLIPSPHPIPSPFPISSRITPHFAMVDCWLSSALLTSGPIPLLQVVSEAILVSTFPIENHIALWSSHTQWRCILYSRDDCGHAHIFHCLMILKPHSWNVLDINNCETMTCSTTLHSLFKCFNVMVYLFPFLLPTNSTQMEFMQMSKVLSYFLWSL